jgi:hypothetical protein
LGDDEPRITQDEEKIDEEASSLSFVKHDIDISDVLDEVGLALLTAEKALLATTTTTTATQTTSLDTHHDEEQQKERFQRKLLEARLHYEKAKAKPPYRREQTKPPKLVVG